MMRKFHFERIQDASGVSGTGVVAEGCIFSSGEVVLHWLSSKSSIAIYGSIQDVNDIHGHGGMTKIVYDD